jgi:hypothetical protein
LISANSAVIVLRSPSLVAGALGSSDLNRIPEVVELVSDN